MSDKEKVELTRHQLELIRTELRKAEHRAFCAMRCLLGSSRRGYKIEARRFLEEVQEILESLEDYLLRIIEKAQ